MCSARTVGQQKIKKIKKIINSKNVLIIKNKKIACVLPVGHAHAG
jgi:hypothetical protein